MRDKQSNCMGEEARIILTNACNFRCVFCHGEGIGDVSKAKWEPDTKLSIDLVNQAIALGCRDITLTGGEPLLKKRLARDLICHIHDTSPEAEVTVVSNLSLLDEGWLKEVAGKARLRINVSMHSHDNQEYQRVTGQQSGRHTINGLRANLALLRQYNVPFKLNCVALQSLASEENFQELCSFAEEEGAIALKILELLIMESCESLFYEYISLDSIRKLLPIGYNFSETGMRREVFRNKNGFKVELQKCRCRLGCNTCVDHMTANFNTEGKFWPCFEGADACYSLSDMPLADALNKGSRDLFKMSRKYGEDSPSLIRDIKLRPTKDETYFTVDDISTISQLVEQSQKIEKISFEEDYFETEPSKPQQYSKVRSHSGNPANSKIILSKIVTRTEKGLVISRTDFLDDKPIPLEETKELLHKVLIHLGWQKKYSVQVKGDLYKAKNKAIFSVCTVEKTLPRSLNGQSQQITLLRADYNRQCDYDLCAQLQEKLHPISQSLPSFFDML